MGIKYRKSIKLTKGIRLNLNKNSTSVTFGRGAVKHTVNSKGRTTRTVGISGTGLYQTETLSNGRDMDDDEIVVSPKFYKVCGIILCVLSSVLALLSLVLLLISPAALLGVALAILFFLLGRRCIKKSKQAEEQQDES